MTDKVLVDNFIDRLRRVFKPDGIREDSVLENLVYHEYYFRTKLYHTALTAEQLDKLLEHFEWSLANGGDAVGMKAALCISATLTQQSLKSIHGIGGGGADVDKVQRVGGIDRFQELLSGNLPKVTVITLRLYDDDKDSCVAFANEQETFYLKHLITDTSLMTANTIDPFVVSLHPELELDKLSINYWYIISIWDISGISEFNIHVCDVIDKLMRTFNEILFITGAIINKYQFKAYIYFKQTVRQERILSLMEEWSQERVSTIVSGGYLKYCHVSENANRPGHYIIEANEINVGIMALENLIFDPRVDPSGCGTADMNATLSIFGVNETAARLHENLLFTATNLSEIKNTLPRHYKVLADTMLSRGEFRYATRGYLRHDNTMDPLKLVNFETPSDMIRSALKSNIYSPVADGVSAGTFGELPNLGTGVSKVTLYKA